MLAGESRAALRAARAAIRLEVEPLPAVLSIDDAIAGGHFIGPTRRLARGDAEAALERAEHVIEGTFRTGGQEHFYLETQAALAIPGEGGQMTVHSSTQNPSEIQAVVAHCLGLGQNMVVCTCTRMGGGFGGKESQAAHPALLAALVAHKTGRPARIVYPRDLDMRVTGKRHPYLCRYRAGFDSDGRIEALSVDLYSDGGCRGRPLAGRHGAIDAPHGQCVFHPQYRGLGHGLPDQSAVEYGDARVRRAAGDRGHRKRDRRDRGLPRHRCPRGAPAELLRRPGRDTTPYGQVVTNNTLPVLIDRLAETADYARRRDEIARSNAASRTHLRGIALTPVKFGISFTRRTLNQANALVNIYLDGTIQVSTGGTEMGQGLNTKIRQIVGGRVRRAARVRPGHAGLDREEQQHLADGRVGEHRFERDGGPARRRGLEGPAGRGGRPAFRLGRRWDRGFAHAHSLRASGGE